MGGDWRSSEVHPFSGSNFLHLYLLPDFEYLQLGLSQSFLGLDQSLGGGQRVGGSGLVDGDTGNFTNRKPRPLEAINLGSGKINLNMRYVRNATKTLPPINLLNLSYYQILTFYYKCNSSLKSGCMK